MTYTYNFTVPNAPNDPADDQPAMLTNTVSIGNLIAVDHVGFNVANGGYHKVVHLVGQNSTPAAVALTGELYSRQITSINNDEALFYQTGGGRNIQMTVNVVPSKATNGYSFLPGGLLVQWGQASSTSIATPNATVTFPIAFQSAPYSVNCTILTNTGTRYAVQLYDLSSNQFRAFVTIFLTGNPVSGATFCWTAIGPAQ